MNSSVTRRSGAPSADCCAARRLAVTVNRPQDLRIACRTIWHWSTCTIAPVHWRRAMSPVSLFFYAQYTATTSPRRPELLILSRTALFDAIRTMDSRRCVEAKVIMRGTARAPGLSGAPDRARARLPAALRARQLSCASIPKCAF